MTTVAIVMAGVALLSGALALAVALGQNIRGGRTAEDAMRARTSAALAHIALVRVVQRLDDMGVLQSEHLSDYMVAARDVLGPDMWAEVMGERDTR